MRHTINVLVENEFGVLARVAGLFSGRGFNIESLSVAETLDPEISQMTIVTEGNEQIVEQIVKQLNKLINVIKVVDLTATEHVARELILVKVGTTEAQRAEIMRIVDIFRGKIVDVAQSELTIEITGADSKTAAFIKLLSSFDVRDVTRTGTIAMPRFSSGGRSNKKA